MVTALTLFNAILLWSLVVRVLMLLGDSLGTLVEMLLVADALTGSRTFYRVGGKY